MEEKKILRIIKIIDPSLCLKCQCACVATVVFEDEVDAEGNLKEKRMFHCSRLDCDNWETSKSPRGRVKLKEL